MATQKSLAGLNLFADSKDLSQPSWAKESNVTATFNQTGLSGSPNDASIVTSTSTINTRISQAITVTPETWVTFRVWLNDDGTTQGRNLQVDVSGGSAQGFKFGRDSVRGVAIPGGSTYFPNSFVRWASPSASWIEFLATFLVPAGGSTLTCYFTPSTNTMSSGASATAGSSIVGNFEAYDNTEMWEVLGQDPVFT